MFVPYSGVSFSMSMTPTIKVGDFGLINQFAYGEEPQEIIQNLRRGDIISFNHTTDGQEHGVAKRLIGLPRDHIEMKQGILYLNGVKLTQGIVDTQDNMMVLKEKIADVSYYVQYNMLLKDGNSNDLRNGEWVVPEGKVFVVGDNRDHSMDSRSLRFGYADLSKVKGKFETIMWNTNELSSLRLNRVGCPLYETTDYLPSDVSCVGRNGYRSIFGALIKVLSDGI
ncbi:signal peptidase I [Vibrio sp. D431a]|nr:signal peptidase I [Vibrio sp. D431a]